MAAAFRLQPLFPLALASVQLPIDSMELMLLIQQAIALRGVSSGNSSEGCAWTGDLNGVWQLHRQAPFASVTRLVLDQAWRYLEGVGFRHNAVALHIQRAWPVLSEPGQVIGRHHHPNAHLSAVLFLNGDGTGRSGHLRLFSSNPCNELVPGLAVGMAGPLDVASEASHQWNAPWFDIAPTPGLLVLFPSSTHHAVTENQDEDDLRCSLAFDLVLTAAETSKDQRADAEYLAPHPSQWMEDASASR